MAVDKDLSVLIVDDIASMRASLRALLGQLGFHNVEEAADGAAALDKARAKTPGLIVSDWNMEPMDGLALLKAVRADSALKRTPFILVSAEMRTDQLIAAKQAGVDNVIVKPFDAETLRAKMAAVLGAF
jgi:two-component system chemotaxis response regulator CheY